MKKIFAEADVIFLGVKPAQFSELLSQYQTILKKRESLLLISMAAGLTLEKLASLLPKSTSELFASCQILLLLSVKGD